MLDALSRYENLGTPDFFWELLTRLKEGGGRWTEHNIREYFSNRIVDGRTVFDGCLPLAEAIELIRPDETGALVIDSAISRFLPSEQYARTRILRMILLALKRDEVFDLIFRPEHISYDIVYHSVQIDISAFPLKYANFRRLLVDFGFLMHHPDARIRKLIVNPRFKTEFDLHILNQVKRRKLGIENLEVMLERNQIHGTEAEEFVVVFEKTRMSSHPKSADIQRISDYDVAAGYDIVSYNNIASPEYDRFIEVKSYQGSKRFYWSKNEISQARVRRDCYFLYLIDRDKMGRPGYEPEVIQNPYEHVFLNQNGWNKEAQTWLFEPK
jgi:Protein NO VEIN, C-terminal